MKLGLKIIRTFISLRQLLLTFCFIQFL